LRNILVRRGKNDTGVKGNWGVREGETMIEALKKIGMSLGDFSQTADAESKKAFLLNLTILPKSHTKEGENPERAIVIDFDLAKETVSIKAGLELCEANREKIFAFSASEIFGSRGAKSALSLNGVYYFFTDEALNAVIDSCKKDSKLKTFLQEYRDCFYSEGILNADKLDKSDKELFLSIKASLQEEMKKEPQPLDVFSKLIQNKFNIKFARIAMVTFCGKSIFEVDSSSTEEYLDLLYKNVFEKYYDKAKDGYCHICGESKKLADKTVPIWNFYGTTNNLYFQNTKGGVYNTSFGICEDCLKPVMVGKNHIQNNLSGQIFGLDCYLIPQFETGDDADEFTKPSIFKKIQKALDSFNPATKEIEELRTIVKNTRSKNLKFDLFFYEQNKNEFRIRKLISNIELSGLTLKLEAFKEKSDIYGLSTLSQNEKNYSEVITLSFLRYALFHSKYSHPKCEPVHYRTELLGFLETFLYGLEYDYRRLVNEFTQIVHHKFHQSDSNTVDFSPFKFVLALQVFIDLGMLKNYENRKEDTKMLTEVPKDFAEFFSAYPKIYGNAPDRQGLFLLGVLVNRIIYAQGGKSSTFMKKINLQGIEPRRVHSLLLHVKEFAEIYKVFEEGSIWASITERLQEIESSPLSAEEVVFYILTGISYAKYIGIKQGKQKSDSIEPEKITEEGE